MGKFQAFQNLLSYGLKHRLTQTPRLAAAPTRALSTLEVKHQLELNSTRTLLARVYRSAITTHLSPELHAEVSACLRKNTDSEIEAQKSIEQTHAQIRSVKEELRTAHHFGRQDRKAELVFEGSRLFDELSSLKKVERSTKHDEPEEDDRFRPGVYS
jgi:uncharacterized protein YcbK (DUF882 family)